LKKLFKRKLFIGILVGFAFSLALIFYFSFRSLVEISLASFSEQGTANLPNQANLLLPTRLKIPKIKADSLIESVGLTSLGAIDSPLGPKNAGWFNLGIIPGENGSAIIDGHSGWKNGIPAVFDSLYKLKKGDKIYVENGKGVTTTFIVREIKNYDPNADAEDVFSSNDNKAHLNLITCGGTWDNTAKTHSKRLVVFTDKVIN